jgi:hypothetical protein
MTPLYGLTFVNVNVECGRHPGLITRTVHYDLDRISAPDIIGRNIKRCAAALRDDLTPRNRPYRRDDHAR